jgi:DNA-binding NtrC family response regulator
MKREHQGERSSTPLIPPRLASQRVLIVEDEKRLREMLVTAIAGMGMQPAAVGSAEAALKLVANASFAIALLDLNLPGMAGLELCRRLRAGTPQIQVILLTGFGDLEAARLAIRLEVVDFLTKPCGMDELESALNRARLRWLQKWTDESKTQAEEPAQTILEKRNDRTEAAPLSEQSMEDMERQLILTALERHQGNRQAAAAELGISVRKVYYRLQQYQRTKRGDSD